MRALLVPVKAFTQAKLRLQPVLGDLARQQLARTLAQIVLEAAGEIQSYVACDDDEVADWAITRGAQVLWTPGLGLSGAVRAGVGHLHAQGVDLVIVSHGDLPLVKSFAAFDSDDSISLAPDRRLDGTNVAAIPRGVDFEFQYGPGSFARHCKEAERLSLRPRIIHDWQLACDVDVPTDLELLDPALLTRLTTMKDVTDQELDGLSA